LPPSDFANITAAELGSVQDATISGYTPLQLNSTDAAAFVGLRAAQFDVLPASLFTYFLAAQVSNLAPVTFARITAAQLGFLTAEAAHGLTADQLTQLNDTAAVGFTDGQIANLNPEACKGIFSHTWLNIPAPLFANVTVQCVQNARDDFLVSVTRAQLAYFNAAQVNALSQNQTTQLTATAAPGLRGAFFSKEGASGLTNVAFGALNPAAFFFWTAEAFASVPPTDFKNIMASQVFYLTNSSFGALTKDQLNNFSPIAAANTTSQQIAQLNQSCAGITPGFLFNVPTTAYGALQAECIEVAPSDAFSVAKAGQLASLPKELFADFTKEQLLNASSTAFTGIRDEQFTLVDGAGFTARLLMGTTAAAFKGLRKQQVQAASDDAFSQVSADQIAYFGRAVQGLRAKQLAAILAPSVAGFGSNAAYFDPPACQGITREQLVQFLPSALNNITAGCFANTSDTITSAFTADQIYALNLDAFGAFDSAKIYNLSDFAFSKASRAQISSLKAPACTGFRSTVFNQISKSGLDGVTSECVSETPVAVFANLATAILEHIPCGGITDEQFHVLPNDTFSDITVECFRNLTPNAFSGISGYQIAGLSPDVVSLISPDQIATIAGDVIGNMTYGQLRYLQPRTSANLTADQLGNLTLIRGLQFVELYNYTSLTTERDEATKFISKIGTQLSEVVDWHVNATDQKNITWLELALTKIATMPPLGDEFVSRFQNSTFLGLRPVHVTEKLTPAAIKQISAGQASYILSAPFQNFTAEQVNLLQPAAFASLNNDVLREITPAQFANTTDDQLAQLAEQNPSIFKDCAFSKSLSKSQVSKLTGDAKTNYNVCVPSGSGTTSPNNTENPDGLTKGQIALIVLGALAAVALIASAVYYMVKRNRSQYQAI